MVLKTKLLFISVFLSLLVLSANGGPRWEALGKVYTPSIPGTEGLGGNPAALTDCKFHMVSASVTRYFIGLPSDAVYTSRIAYAHPTYKWGSFGLDVTQFAAGPHSSFGLGVGYAYPFRFGDGNTLSAGTYMRLIRNQYKLAENEPSSEDDNTTTSFGIDIGLLFKRGRFAAGLGGRNLVKPSLSLTGETGVGNGDPQEVALGFSYSVFDWFVPMVQGSWNELEDITASAGAEFLLFKGLLSLRVGYYEGNITTGFGIYGAKGFPVNFDYALRYPESSLGDAGEATHVVGVSANIAPVKKEIIPEDDVPKVDIALKRDPSMPALLFVGPDGKAELSAIVMNNGTEPSDSFTVTAFIVNSDTQKVGEPITVPFLLPGDKKKLSWMWTGDVAGDYDFIVSADDSGTLTPLLMGKIEELNEYNNRLLIPVTLTGDIVADIEVQHLLMELVDLTYIAEEEPRVPVIFFEEGSKEVSERFQPTLEILADRLKVNPSIVLGLRGYVDPESDPADWEKEELHIARAREVKNQLIKLGTPDTSIEIIEENYDPTLSRFGGRTASPYETEQDRLWFRQENRRVELNSSVKFYEGPIFTYEFPNAELTVPKSALDSLSMFACEASGILEENPEVSIILEGTASWSHSYCDLYNFLEGIRTQVLEGVSCPIDSARFPIVLAPEMADEASFQLKMLGEALIFRPREAALAAKDFTIPEDMKRNKITVEVKVGEANRYSILVVNSKGDIIKLLDEGPGLPEGKSVYYWDWRDKNGNLVDPRETYHVELIAEDLAGGTSRLSSKDMRIKIKGIEKRRESSIIVQFAFDDITATSRYLESRLEMLAGRIKSEAENPHTKSVAVKIFGHTDPIGTNRRNVVLSQERAAREETNIRRYLRCIVGATMDSELDRWLADHNVTLVAQGVAHTDPYEVERYRDGKFEKVLIGNNTFPEGRAVNRRVIIQMESIRQYEK